MFDEVMVVFECVLVVGVVGEVVVWFDWYVVVCGMLVVKVCWYVLL